MGRRSRVAGVTYPCLICIRFAQSFGLQGRPRMDLFRLLPGVMSRLSGLFSRLDLPSGLERGNTARVVLALRAAGGGESCSVVAGG
jgi:hypothetical protein